MRIAPCVEQTERITGGHGDAAWIEAAAPRSTAGNGGRHLFTRGNVKRSTFVIAEREFKRATGLPMRILKKYLKAGGVAGENGMYESRA